VRRGLWIEQWIGVFARTGKQTRGDVRFVVDSEGGRGEQLVCAGARRRDLGNYLKAERADTIEKGRAGRTRKGIRAEIAERARRSGLLQRRPGTRAAETVREDRGGGGPGRSTNGTIGRATISTGRSAGRVAVEANGTCSTTAGTRVGKTNPRQAEAERLGERDEAPRSRLLAPPRRVSALRRADRGFGYLRDGPAAMERTRRRQQIVSERSTTAGGRVVASVGTRQSGGRRDAV